MAVRGVELIGGTPPEPVLLPPGEWCRMCGRPEVFDGGEGTRAVCADVAGVEAPAELDALTATLRVLPSSPEATTVTGALSPPNSSSPPNGRERGTSLSACATASGCSCSDSRCRMTVITVSRHASGTPGSP